MPKPRRMVETSVVREVIYPEVEVSIAFGPDAITAQQAKDLLGWEESEGADGSILTDENGKRIRCTNNANNRPFAEGWSRTLAQDILNRHWKPNGETIVIGKTGRVLSGQHRLIGLVLAAQIWAGPQKHHWQEKWDDEPTIESIIVFGIDEAGSTTRTLDNVKPRDLKDVLFTDEETFGTVKGNDREKLCRMLDYSIRLLWEHTGAKDDAYTPRRTHSEALDFIDRHAKTKKVVKHMFDEDKDRAVSNLLSPGYASGLLYLMSAANSDGDVYRNMDSPSEKKVDWTMHEKAREFWVLLTSGNPSLKGIRYALAEISGVGGTGNVSVPEVKAVITLGWKVYLEKGSVDDGDIDVEAMYKTNEDGIKVLKAAPDVGGIDLGPASRRQKKNEGEGFAQPLVEEPDEPGEGDPAPDEISAGKEEADKARRERAEALAAKMKADRARKAQEARAAAATATPEAEPETNPESPSTPTEESNGQELGGAEEPEAEPKPKNNSKPRKKTEEQLVQEAQREKARLDDEKAAAEKAAASNPGAAPNPKPIPRPRPARTK